MKYSENLHLALPEGDDVLEVSKLSENFEALDGAIKETQAASGYQIGDTLTTWRTDLGENWLLCNGDWLDSEDYPKLFSVSPGVEGNIKSEMVKNLFGVASGRGTIRSRSILVNDVFIRMDGSSLFVYDPITNKSSTIRTPNSISNLLI